MDEQAFIDGTHPALAGNSSAERSSSPTRSVSPTPSASSSNGGSSGPRFSAVDDAPPPPASNPPVRGGGASNTGPKGVLADWAARQSTGGLGASNTGPKGVLSDWRGSQAASAEKAMENLSLGFVASNGTIVKLNQGEDPESDDEKEGGDEDEARERYRRRRLMEMQGSGERGGVSGPGMRRRHFGHLREIGIEQFLSAVDDEAEEVAVVLHLYESEIEACAILNQHLSSIARVYPRTKFIRALATEVDFAADNEDDTLPTLLVYRGGELETTLVRPDLEWGRGARNDVIALLQRHEAISGVAVVPLNTASARADRSDSADSD